MEVSVPPRSPAVRPLPNEWTPANGLLTPTPPGPLPPSSLPCPPPLPPAVRLVPYEWTPANGLLTPTHKLVRHELRRRFKQEIAAMASELGDA